MSQVYRKQIEQSISSQSHVLEHIVSNRITGMDYLPIDQPCIDQMGTNIHVDTVNPMSKGDKLLFISTLLLILDELNN